MWGQPPSAVQRAKPARFSAHSSLGEPMSTRSSIWLGQSEGKCVHTYWELAERELDDGRAPIYLAADDGDAEKEVAIRCRRKLR